MINKKIILKDGARKSVKTSQFLGIAVLACLIAVLGNSACKKTEEESALLVKEGLLEFEGTAAVTHGKFLYVPEAQGFDIVVQGTLNSGDLSTLIDKEVRGEGEFTPELPSILVATTIEVKDESGVWMNVFTKTEDVVLDDYMDLQAREGYPILQGLAYNKNEDWEGLGNVKIQGLLEEEEGAYKIVVFDDKDKQVGKILVDNISDFAQYYIKKLGLFDRFWFYITIKDTVEWSLRRTSRDLFHADI
ncbi:MAG: hypothetical protein MUP98_06040, partial [Candidatus Aminicenantes bacterium]|nr:hypothetical protein [Candidatus Aminicenantes bacterium]